MIKYDKLDIMINFISIYLEEYFAISSVDYLSRNIIASKLVHIVLENVLLYTKSIISYN